MADKMMRMAGRGEDGTAKAIRTDNNGNVNTLIDSKTILNQVVSTHGPLVPANGTWDSAVASSLVFKTLNFTHLHLRASIGTNFKYSVEIIEILRGSNGTAHEGRKMLVLNNSEKTDNTVVKIDYAEFKIKLYNNSSESKNIAIYAYLKNFSEPDLTGKTIYEATNKNEVLLTETLSSHGRSVPANGIWDSAVHSGMTFNVRTYTHLHLRTFLSVNFRYSVEIVEIIRNAAGSSAEGRKLLIMDTVLSNKETLAKVDYAEFKIKVYNHSDTARNVGIYAYLKNVPESDKLVETSTKSPNINNLEVIENNLIPQDFHKGLFYASKYNSNEIYTSSDGREWTLKGTIPNNDAVAKIVISDTGRLVVATTEGNVFVSDESQQFQGTSPVISSGKFDNRFGSSKYLNIILISTYETHGPDYMHEAFLSTDNGETFTKIFDNNTLTSFNVKDDRYHIHSVEYDPYNGNIYVWGGDFDNRAIFLSKDFGKTWSLPITRSLMRNTTQLISTEKGLALGADSERGGVSFIEIDRTVLDQTLEPSKYKENHFLFTTTTDRWIATRPYVNRAKNIYIMGYTAEYSDKSGYVLHSENGYDWKMLYRTNTAGSYYGINTSVFGNGIALFGQRNNQNSTFYQTVVADIEI